MSKSNLSVDFSSFEQLIFLVFLGTQFLILIYVFLDHESPKMCCFSSNQLLGLCRRQWASRKLSLQPKQITAGRSVILEIWSIPPFPKGKCRNQSACSFISTRWLSYNLTSTSSSNYQETAVPNQSSNHKVSHFSRTFTFLSLLYKFSDFHVL